MAFSLLPTAGSRRLHEPPPRVNHDLFSSTGFSALKALGNPQYLAPVAHTIR